jgi:hypothetical protein
MLKEHGSDFRDRQLAIYRRSDLLHDRPCIDLRRIDHVE